MTRLFEPTCPEQTVRKHRARSAVLCTAGMACVLSTLAAAEPKSAELRVQPDSGANPTSPLVRHLQIRLSWGHQSASPRGFRLDFSTNPVAIVRLDPEGLETADTLDGGVAETRAGGGDVDAVIAAVSWQEPVQPSLKVQSIWQYLLEHGTADQVARLKDDPGLQPGAPVLTVLTADDGTRGFSIGLEQLARHRSDVAAGTRRVRDAGGRAGGFRDPSGVARGRTGA